MSKPCVHALLPYESIAFLVLMRLPLPIGLPDYATRFGACLTFAT